MPLMGRIHDEEAWREMRRDSPFVSHSLFLFHPLFVGHCIYMGWGKREDKGGSIMFSTAFFGMVTYTGEKELSVGV